MVENMNWLIYFLAFIGGTLLSLVYFLGLWYTVQKIPQMSRYYYVMLFFSFLARVAITLTGFYFILMLGWVPALLAFLGFLITRQIVVYKIGSPAQLQTKDEYGN